MDERELVQHAQNIEVLNNLRAEAASYNANTSELEEARAAAEARMKATQESMAEMEAISKGTQCSNYPPKSHQRDRLPLFHDLSLRIQ